MENKKYLLDEFGGATSASSSRRLMSPKMTFTSGQRIDQAVVDDFTNVYVYKDGSHELGKCSRDGEVLCVFQLGATINKK